MIVLPRILAATAELTEASDMLTAACFNLREAMAIMAKSSEKLARVTEKMAHERFTSASSETKRLTFMLGNP